MSDPTAGAATMTTTTTTKTTTTTTTTTSSAAAAPFRFPPEYHFPAFFTWQPNRATQSAQQRTWARLVLDYARHRRLFRLRVSEATSSSSSSSSSHSTASDLSELFWNRALGRRLQPGDVRALMAGMVRDGRAEYLSGEDGGGGGGSGEDVVLLYWRRADEWADLLERFVEETGQRGGVLTVWEICEGDGTRNTEIHGIDSQVLLKALNVLVRRGRAQVFGQQDSLGVKFF